MLGKLISLLISFVILVVAIFAIDWFITGSNAALAGSKVNDGATSIMDFVSAAFGR